MFPPRRIQLVVGDHFFFYSCSCPRLSLCSLLFLFSHLHFTLSFSPLLPLQSLFSPPLLLPPLPCSPLLLPSAQPVGGIEACKLAQSAGEWSENPFLLYSRHERLRCHIPSVPPHSSRLSLFSLSITPAHPFLPSLQLSLFILSIPLLSFYLSSLSFFSSLLSHLTPILSHSLPPLSPLSHLTFTPLSPLSWLLHHFAPSFNSPLLSCPALSSSCQSSDYSIGSQAVCINNTVPFVHMGRRRGSGDMEDEGRLGEKEQKRQERSGGTQNATDRDHASCPVHSLTSKYLLIWTKFLILKSKE